MYGMETAINNSKIFNTYNNGTERKYYINFRERVKENNVLLLLSTVSPIIFILSATKATCSRENFVYQMIRLYSIKKEKLNQSTFSPGLPIVQAFCRSSVFCISIDNLYKFYGFYSSSISMLILPVVCCKLSTFTYLNNDFII